MTTYTQREISLLVLLAANLDPDRYSNTEAKALIYKCQVDRDRAEKSGCLETRISFR